jgi:hypothetical protein
MNHKSLKKESESEQQITTKKQTATNSSKPQLKRSNLQRWWGCPSLNPFGFRTEPRKERITFYPRKKGALKKNTGSAVSSPFRAQCLQGTNDT